MTGVNQALRRLTVMIDRWNSIPGRLVTSSAAARRQGSRPAGSAPLRGPFSPEKALRSFFCVQRCRLTVGDKPLLPDTLSAEERCVVCRLDLTLIMGRDIWRYKKTTMSRLSLNERLWGGRVSDPPVKAGAERKKKTAFQGFFWREGTPEGRRAGGAVTLPPRSRA